MTQVIIQTLSTKFSEKQSKQFESLISKKCKELDQTYEEFAYEKIGELMVEDDKKKQTQIISDGCGWNSVTYKHIRDKQLIENERELNPPEVQEGVYTCRKCKSKKTLSYGIQTRSADEPMTMFIKCVDCGQRWKD